MNRETASLDATALRNALPPRTTVGREILVFAETDSTNDLARRAGDDGLAEGLVIFAEEQRAGRGTQGRAWVSPPGVGLWLSLLLRPQVPVGRWPELTFCAALAVAETAEKVTGQVARIKWPNDVTLQARKVAGILVECHHRQSSGFAVVGIGLNVLQEEANFASELRHSAASLKMMSNHPAATVGRDDVAAILLERLDHHYMRWPHDFPMIAANCRARGCEPPTATR